MTVWVLPKIVWGIAVFKEAASAKKAKKAQMISGKKTWLVEGLRCPGRHAFD